MTLVTPMTMKNEWTQLMANSQDIVKMRSASEDNFFLVPKVVE